MTQEDKEELLLKDLAARLPYGVKGKCEVDASYDTPFSTIEQTHKFNALLEGIKDETLFVTPLIEDNDEQDFAYEEVADGIDVLDFMPYLRPLSSMTEEERKEYEGFIIHREHVNAQGQEWYIACFSFNSVPRFIDWLNAHHFDYHNLIEKGLALEASSEMYK